MRTVLAVALATAVTVAVGASPAGANTSKANTQAFSRSASVVNTNIQTCVRYTISGQLKYTARRFGPTGINHNIEWRLQNPRIVKPVLAAHTYNYDPGSHVCTTRLHKFSEIKIYENWAGYACNWHPRISISPPFKVGVSFWPSCSSKSAGLFHASKSSPASGLVSGWDDDAVKYGNQALGLKPKGIPPDKPKCYGVVAKFEVLNGESWRSFKSPSRSKVCPRPKW